MPEIGTADEPRWIAEHYPPASHIIVADGYQFDATYQKALKAEGYYLVYIDDLVRGTYHADVIVNHSLAAAAGNYQTSRPARFALGSGYSMLRQPFLAATCRKPEARGKQNAFVCFGGADTQGFSLMTVKTLMGFPGIRKINVVAGASVSESAFEELGKLSPCAVIHRNLDAQSLVALMESSDFAVVSASNVLYEVCAVKLPVAAGYYVENQIGLYKGLLRKGAIFGCGDISNFTEGDFEKALSRFVNESDFEQQLKAQADLFDDKIEERLLQMMLPVTYRLAGEGDLVQVFEWANDPLTRANSYNSEQIQLGQHTAWFRRKITQPDTRMFIAELDGRPAGMVRYDSAGDHSVVGVLVGAEFRGRGLAQIFLRETAVLYFKTFTVPIHAFIKADNKASVRAFELAGYKFVRSEPVQGVRSFVYQLQTEDVQ